MGNLREQSYLDQHPCSFKIREFDKKPPTGAVEKVKQVIQKLDVNGNPIYKTIPIPTSGGGGCGCKSKNNGPAKQLTTEVPDTVEVWVDQPISTNDTRMVLCKLYGAVKKSHCLNCKSYKASK